MNTQMIKKMSNVCPAKYLLSVADQLLFFNTHYLFKFNIGHFELFSPLLHYS